MKKLINLVALVILVSTNVFTPFSYAQVDNSGESGILPENTVEVPEGNTETPESDAEISENNTENTGEVEETPENNVESPENNAEIPGNDTENAGEVSQDTPENNSQDNALPDNQKDETTEGNETGELTGSEAITDDQDTDESDIIDENLTKEDELLTQDVNGSGPHDLTTFERAFQEVAYAYYMRGPYIHYNLARGKRYHSPEDATSQDYDYLACGIYVKSVYDELLGTNMHYHQFNSYAKEYVGKRSEVIGYGELQTGGVDSGKLYWWDGTTECSGEPKIINPTKSDIISGLQIGDIFGYKGHVMLVYDLVYDNSGNVVDVYLIHSTRGKKSYFVDSKIGLNGTTVYGSGGIAHDLWIGYGGRSQIIYNNIDRKDTEFEHHSGARVEGTVALETMTEAISEGRGILEFNPSKYSDYYYIIRPVTTDGSGNSLLNLNGAYLVSRTSGTYPRKDVDDTSGYFCVDEDCVDRPIEYSDSVQSRLKYSKLYIEKTVDKRDNNIVEPGDELTYTIKIQNNSNEAYTSDLTVIENIDTNLVENLHNSSYTNKVQLESDDENQIQWRVGELASGEEVIIEYTVKVKTGNVGETIESIGLVGNIPSGTVTNKIGKSTVKGENLKDAYNNLTGSGFTGKILINEIYKEAYGIDLGLDKIVKINTTSQSDTGALIYYNNKWGDWWSGDDSKMWIIKGNPCSKMVLNGYFNVLYRNNGVTGYDGSEDIKIPRYSLPALSVSSNDPDKRSDTIFPSDFITGDILIYKNSNDIRYTWKKENNSPAGGRVIPHINTYESGDYAYIYMDGKFVGVNLGNDGQAETSDDRNEFTTEYYINKGQNNKDLNLYRADGSTSSGLVNMTNELEEFLLYQSLLGKDAYVILRPSLAIRSISYELDGGTNNVDNKSGFVLGSDVELKDPTKDGFIFQGWYTDSGYTNQVNNTSDLTDDTVLYAKWGNNASGPHELSTFEQAFQEVAYAYYMRGPYIHYNVSKGYGDVNAVPPEESTSQDYNYLACGLYVMNVYKELLNIKLYQASLAYASGHFGDPEVIGYGVKSGNNLYWYDKEHDRENPLSNPTTGDIIKLLEIGDILHYNGHEMLVYDVIYDGSGNKIDVYLVHATAGGSYYPRSKTHPDRKIYNISGNAESTVSLRVGHAPWANLYYNNIDNTGLYSGTRIEGTLKLQKFTEAGINALLFTTGTYVDDYAILRFVTSTQSGDILNFDGKFNYYTGETNIGEIITGKVIEYSDYSDRVKSRLKYSKLYIEKTVDKKDNNIVEPGDELMYTIKIQNNSNEAYTSDLTVIENINRNLVDYLRRTSTGDVELISTGDQLKWNIGMLNSGEEVIIEYTVKVKAGNIGKTIESTGKVDNIPSGTVKNKIGKNLKEQYSNSVKGQYDGLKTQFTGKTLINEIYKKVYDVDLGLDHFNITPGTGDENLIYFNNKRGSNNNWQDSTYLYINKKNAFSGMVLNSYFNALHKAKVFTAYNSLGEEINVQLYALPSLSLRKNDPDKRANTIYPTDFQTGDVLIYLNENDIYYSTGGNITIDKNGTGGYTLTSMKETYRTYENGEYAYIYLSGKFVGVNSGNDLINTKDDRNEFTLSYYTNNNLSGYTISSYKTSLKTGFGEINMPDGGEEWLQYQTLFGKDAYVILRPSLVIRNISYELDGGTNNVENKSGFVLGRDVELKEPTKSGFTFQGWYTDSGYTNEVNNTRELTDDTVLYAKWSNGSSDSHELSKFQKAFQEVAYAYYMRGPYLHYNTAKGRGRDFSPEEATSQDYNYLACGLYVLNVYKELLGNIISFPYGGGQNAYAKKYVGERPEVIAYGEFNTGEAYWEYGTGIIKPQECEGTYPTKSCIVKQLKIGDIFGYDGHVMLVYDYKYNENGDIEDVYLIHSTSRNQYRVDSKIHLDTTVYSKLGTAYVLSLWHNKRSGIRYNNFDRKTQSGHHSDARVEGTINLQTISDYAKKSAVLNFNPAKTGQYSSHYYILRFVTTDDSGNSMLSINGTLTGYQESPGDTYVYDNEPINYSNSVNSRLKYSKLYIEKTVDKWDNSIVGKNDELTYTIKIQNNSNEAYTSDLIVIENINTNLVDYLRRTSTGDVELISTGDQLKWNIGILNSGEEVIIEYTVKVKSGNIGQTIESTGMVDNIPSGTVTNTIGKNTDKGENLAEAYNNLKDGNFTGKTLINEIYKEVYGIDLELDKIVKINTTNTGDKNGLIYYNNTWGRRDTNWDNVKMRINKKSPYSGMILNGYFNVLCKAINAGSGFAFDGSGDIEIPRYGFPAIAVKSNDPDKRADTIFPSNFQTGDVLIYKNSNDIYYTWTGSSVVSGGHVGGHVISHINTYEDGEYAYIYLSGKFVGINLGSDGLTETLDDRNEFTTEYYINKGDTSKDLRLYTTGDKPTSGYLIDMPGGFENWLQYQSLFGKEAYVILRPSLAIRSISYELDGGINNVENKSGFVLGRDVELKEPRKSGYTFNGWYTDSEYTNQVDNTSELTDDVTLYAKWDSGSSDSHELSKFQKAFQEVAYAYYMRGPYLQYNLANGKGQATHPEESTSQEYNYLTCTVYIQNVYKELAGIIFPYGSQYGKYVKEHIGKRPEAVGYGELQDNGDLYWWDGTTKYASGYNKEHADISYIINQLQIGDVFGYDGHGMLVYDYKYNERGEKEDVYLIHSITRNNYTVDSKIHPKTTVYDHSGNSYDLHVGHGRYSLIRYNNFDRTTQSEHHSGARVEGTIALQTMSEAINQRKELKFESGKYSSYYYIIRPITTSGDGKSILNFDGSFPGFQESSGSTRVYNNEQIKYSGSLQSRLEYNKLYIEKTVDKWDNSMVGENDELTYTIKIQNNSNEAYTSDLTVIENIDTNLVQNLGRYNYKKNGTPTSDIQLSNNGNQLEWNIGTLDSGDEVIIEYTVKVKPGNIGQTIESTGMVDNIPSGTVTNTIGKNTDKGENLKDTYNNLKGEFTGKTLVNEVYKEVYGIDLGLDKIEEISTKNETNTGALIYYNNSWGMLVNNRDEVKMQINKKSPYSRMVLNGYFNVLYQTKYYYTELVKAWNGEKDIQLVRYALPSISLKSNNPDKRVNTIFPSNFQTGDVLIYKNSDDIKYTRTGTPKTGHVVPHINTYESGEYAYIYIDGKFVGVNLGNDGQSGTLDDRNEFTIQYYNDKNLSGYSVINSPTSVSQIDMPGGFENWLQYQSLFGKDAYVILRPSLAIRSISYELGGGTNNVENKSGFVLGRDVELKEPRKSGYTFNGWYTDSGYTNEVNNTNELTDDTVLYAKWGLNPEYEINYELNGGAVSGKNATRYTIESETITLINPTRTGYTFAGWSGSNIDGVSLSVVIPSGSTGDRNYEANWDVNQYTITFNTDGGSEVASITADYDSAITAPANPTKNGYRFIKWDPELPATMPLDGLSVKAVWEKNGSSGGGGGGGSSSGGSHEGSNNSSTGSNINTDQHGSADEKPQKTKENDETEKAIENVVNAYKDKNGNTPRQTVVSNNSDYTEEFNKAYSFAKANGITTMSSIESAKMYKGLTRIAMAKMLSNYAMNVLGMEPDLSKGMVNFNDVSSKLDKQYDNGVTLAYQLGIMGINMKNNNFRPNDTITRGEFATALSRLLYNTPDGNPYYTTHIQKLKKEGILLNDNPKIKESRGYVMIMLMRSAK